MNVVPPVKGGFWEARKIIHWENGSREKAGYYGRQATSEAGSRQSGGEGSTTERKVIDNERENQEKRW